MALESIISGSPKVGVGVFVLNREGRFVLGKRKGSHGQGTLERNVEKSIDMLRRAPGTWALPGGHLEAGESFEACAAREVLEETNITIKNVRFLTATNDVMAAEGKHYVTVWVAGETVDAEPNAEVSLIAPCFDLELLM